MHEILQPEGWPRPAGYANGVAARGRLIFTAGQIGWNDCGIFDTDDFTAQTRQALKNTVAVLAAAGAKPEHITSMTWYVVSKAEYLANLKSVGAVWREVIGKQYCAMAAVEVAGLMENRARIEIQAIAVVPD